MDDLPEMDQPAWSKQSSAVRINFLDDYLRHMGAKFNPSGWWRGAWVMVFVAVAAGAFGQPAPSRSREFPPGAMKRIEDLPAGRFRAQIDRLPPAGRQRALEWLQGFHFTELDLDSLHADAEGGVFYVDHFTIPPKPAAASTPVTAASSVPVSPFPDNLVFHSRPGAPNTLYLNFTGESVSGTLWNSSLGRTPIPAQVFSTDADFTTYSDTEQLIIKRVWQRVSEDYAPFDIDVTTERPATFTTRTAMALVTESTDANGAVNPSGATAGGVAYVNVFASGTYATYRPAWIYTDNLANTASYIAEAVSHEIGHNMGLSHDGQTGDPSGYYGGHGTGDTSWGPIMGTGYDRNVSQWSKGEYYLANNSEDDLAIIAGKITYRADDHGDTRATATPLVITGGTNIVSSTPENDPANTSPVNKGVLERNTDVDVFSFVTGSGPVNLTVNPWISPSGTRAGNLDILLELYDATGTLVLTNNPFSTTYASIQTTLSEGLYYLYVRNTGVGNPLSSTPDGYTAYGSVGQYFISGSLVVAPPQAQLQVADITQIGVGMQQFTVIYSGNVPVDVTTIDSSDLRIIGPNNYDRLAQFVSVDIASNGSPRVVTYSAGPPVGGVWSNADNGLYTIAMLSQQVKDTDGASVTPKQLGLFTVNVPTAVYSDKLDALSGWTLDSGWEFGVPRYAPGTGPTSGFTGTNIIGYNLGGNYARNIFPTRYATTPVIDGSTATSLTLRFQRWLRVKNGDTANIQISANGSAWTDVWTAPGNVLDGAWQQVQYDLPGFAVGSASVQVRWGMASDGSSISQNDIGWNFDDVEILRGGAAGPFATNFALTATANNPLWGAVSPSGATYAMGLPGQVTATPATYYRFASWTGDASVTNNPLTVVLNSNLAVQAVFAEIVTTNHPTPYWWLASYGYTQNFETVVTNLGGNKMPLWQSYVAGLNPNDPASQLRLSLTPGSNGASVVLNWVSVTGRVYTVSSSTNLSTGFLTLANATNLPFPVNRITNAVGPSSPMKLYRLEVQKP